jgi:hypothetical protein
MIEQVRAELLHILKRIPEIISNSAKLAELSDYSIRSASIYQDSDSISIAIIVYSLSKMIARHESHDLPQWDEIYPQIRNEIELAAANLESGDIAGFRSNIKEMMNIVGSCDKDIKLYIDKVIEKARIKKGSKIFEQGVSVQRAAKLMGTSVWELMNYIGKTEIMDKDPVRAYAKGRIMFAKRIFNVK